VVQRREGIRFHHFRELIETTALKAYPAPPGTVPSRPKIGESRDEKNFPGRDFPQFHGTYTPIFFLFHQQQVGWPNGKALDYESRDCRFDPCVDQHNTSFPWKFFLLLVVGSVDDERWEHAAIASLRLQSRLDCEVELLYWRRLDGFRPCWLTIASFVLWYLGRAVFGVDR
jgi:hypothetical protein